MVTAKTKAPKRQRRVRSRHPGVVLKKRVRSSGLVRWRAIYVDADTGQRVYETLDPQACANEAARVRWAKGKAAALAKARAERAAGILAPKAPLEIEAAIGVFLSQARAENAAKTIAAHETAFGQLRTWAKRARVRTLADLTQDALIDLRTHLISATSRHTGQRRRPATINRELRSIKRWLRALRGRGLTPGLHRDDIADALAPTKQARDLPTFYRSQQIQALLEAALRHDADAYDATRGEHAAGKARRGSTRRHRPIAPFLAFVLLTGMRRSEALGMEWDFVELAAADDFGNVTGAIRLPARVAKGRRARTVWLDVSPALTSLLRTMRLQSQGSHVFEHDGEPYTVGQVVSARKLLTRDYGAPAFTYQHLRSTCATWLVCSPGIFAASVSLYRAASQLGHSIAVAERHYLNLIVGVPAEAADLETAMDIGPQVACVTEDVAAHHLVKVANRAV